MQVLRFIDIGGHEKYLKTALYGMTSLLPDYVLLCVNAGARCGSALPRASREHLAVTLALEIPLAVVLTQAGPPYPSGSLQCWKNSSPVSAVWSRVVPLLCHRTCPEMCMQYKAIM